MKYFNDTLGRKIVEKRGKQTLIWTFTCQHFLAEELSDPVTERYSGIRLLEDIDIGHAKHSRLFVLLLDDVIAVGLSGNPNLTRVQFMLFRYDVINFCVYASHQQVFFLVHFNQTIYWHVNGVIDMQLYFWFTINL